MSGLGFTLIHKIFNVIICSIYFNTAGLGYIFCECSPRVYMGFLPPPKNMPLGGLLLRYTTCFDECVYAYTLDYLPIQHTFLSHTQCSRHSLQIDQNPDQNLMIVTPSVISGLMLSTPI